MGHLREVFHSLIRAYNRVKRSHNSTLVASLETCLAANYARPDLGLSVIADTSGISGNCLSNFFKEQTGECLSAAIQRTRFSEAERLLLETDESVDTISVRCGYANVSSFRRAFKRWSGLSPSQYRMRREREIRRPRAP